MKIKIPVLLIITLFSIAAASAQSGRITTVPTVPAEKPTVQVTQDPAEIKKQDAVTYSESSPGARRLILPPNKNRTPKKDAKSERKNKPRTEQSPTVNTQTADEEEAIKVETNLVTIPVSVTDRNGFYIADLKQTDFKIFEDDVEQEVAYFGASETPFTVVLLIDISPSTAYQIEEIQAAASAFIKQLKPQDKVIVIQFDDSVKVLSELTNDHDKINKAISRTDFGDGTSIYEAIDFSLHKRLNQIEGRKAIVLFTDGVDTSSEKASFEETVRDAEESGAVIFPIYYNTFSSSFGGTSNVEYARGKAYLTELAAATGGKMVRAESNQSGLTAAFESIAEELRRQYSVGYYPANAGTTGERRQIRVRVNRPKLLVRARDSYIVGGSF
ncbi:MAG TPA: VWA domain-containing protein [Pyrinomonadaceae bacterium]|nr:VWA domain-containing protein [Pyrinomonadaceae bacterium]